MIKEIKRRLGNGETVELECIAPAEFIDQHEENEKILSLKRIAIMSYQPETWESIEGFYLDVGSDEALFLEMDLGRAFLTMDEMKYFKLKYDKDSKVKFIRLTSHHSNSEIYINIDKIIYFKREEDYTHISLNEAYSHVKETPSEIIELLKEAND